jgi:hypothetical protein
VVTVVVEVGVSVTTTATVELVVLAPASGLLGCLWLVVSPVAAGSVVVAGSCAVVPAAAFFAFTLGLRAPAFASGWRAADERCVVTAGGAVTPPVASAG